MPEGDNKKKKKEDDQVQKRDLSPENMKYYEEAIFHDQVVGNKYYYTDPETEEEYLIYKYKEGYNPLRHDFEKGQKYKYTVGYARSISDDQLIYPAFYIFEDKFGEIEAERQSPNGDRIQDLPPIGRVEARNDNQNRFYNVVRTEGEAYKKMVGDRFAAFYPQNGGAGYRVVRYNLPNYPGSGDADLVADYDPYHQTVKYGKLDRKGNIGYMGVKDEQVFQRLDFLQEEKYEKFQQKIDERAAKEEFKKKEELAKQKEIEAQKAIEEREKAEAAQKRALESFKEKQKAAEEREKDKQAAQKREQEKSEKSEQKQNDPDVRQSPKEDGPVSSNAAFIDNVAKSREEATSPDLSPAHLEQLQQVDRH